MAAGPSLQPKNVDRDASVLLLGMPGNGKSTFAVILSVAFGWPVRESTQYLKSRIGQSLESYKKEVSSGVYQEHLKDAIESLLESHRSKCVIVCDVAAVQGGLAAIRKFATTNLVIHVERDLDGVGQHLRSWNSRKIEQLHRLVTPLFRSCANLEYYNITETGSGEHNVPISHALKSRNTDSRPQQPINLPSLALKGVERDFLRFVCAARNVESGTSGDISSPLSKTLTEKRTYTYVVSLDARDVRTADLEDAATAADAFEITVGVDNENAPSLSEISYACARVRLRTRIPIILHVLKPEIDRENNDAYLTAVNHCLRLSPDYATIDLSNSKPVISRFLARKGCSKVIAHLNLNRYKISSWHDSACLDVYNMAKSLGCDVIRLCLSPTSMSDNFAIQSFRNYIDVLPAPNPPLIAYNTGPLGRTSLCLNSIMTPVKAENAAARQDSEAPRLTARESTAALFGLYVHVPLKFMFAAADAGSNLSPIMHNAAFKAFGISHSYGFCHCESVADIAEAANSPSFGGMSLGPPFKAEAIKLVQTTSENAKIIGAINTIIPGRRKVLSDTSIERAGDRHIGAFQGPDQLHGDNTDWIGIAVSVQRGLSPVNAVRAKSCALVVGSGSLASAAVYSLLCLGVQNVLIYNRTQNNAENLASRYLKLQPDAIKDSLSVKVTLEALQIKVVTSFDDPIVNPFSPPSIIVSCIPNSGYVLPTHWLNNSTGGVVLDLAYGVQTTALLDQVWSLSEKGWVALHWYDFLLEQGCPQFELFTGRRAPRWLMHNKLLAHYQDLHLERGSSQPPS